MIDLDNDDSDLNMHPMRDPLPRSDPPDDDDVRWKPSQPLRSLFPAAELEKLPDARPRETAWLCDSSPPVASTSSTLLPSVLSVVPPSAHLRRYLRPSHAARTKSLSGRCSTSGSGSPSRSSPADVEKLIKHIAIHAAGADENAGIRQPPVGSSSRSRETRKIGVKERTMNVHRDSPMGSRGSKSGKGKSRDREHRDAVRPLMRTTSMTSSSMSSLGDSSSSSLSNSADTAMTTPEPDTRQRLMPPPPVPHNRAQGPSTLDSDSPQFSSNAATFAQPFPRPSAQSTPPRVLRAYPHTAQRGAPPDSRTAHQHQPSHSARSAQLPHSQRQAASSGRAPALQPEPRLHPLLQQKTSVGPAPPVNTRAITSSNPRAVPPPALSQTQPEQRRALPALGMRRSTTLPPAAPSNAPLASQASRKFRPPLRNPPNATASGAQTKTEPKPRSAPVKTEAPVMASPARPKSSESDNSFSFDSSSFDMDELEKVMSAYD